MVNRETDGYVSISQKTLPSLLIGHVASSTLVSPQIFLYKHNNNSSSPSNSSAPTLSPLSLSLSSPVSLKIPHCRSPYQHQNFLRGNKRRESRRERQSRKKTMKENTTTSEGGSEQSSSLLASATEDEILVAQILLDLPYLVGMVESISGYKWCRKKKRSGRGHGASPSCAPPSPSSWRTGLQVEDRKPRAKADDCAAGAVNSPVTPLSFSSGESDEKPRHASQKISRKRV